MPTTTTHPDLVLLSSSPPQVPDSDIISTPLQLRDPPLPLPPSAQPPQSPVLSSRSSSSLPSPSLLFKRPALQDLKSGSRAAPIPDGVSLGFASAGALVRDHVLSLDAEEEQAEDGGGGGDGGRDARGAGAEGESGRAKATKRAPRKAAEGAVAKKPRKGRQKKDERKDVPLVVDSVEESLNDRRKQINDVEGTGVSKDHQNAATLESRVPQKPKKSKTKAKLNNSELIKDVLGLDHTVEVPQNELRRGGAVEKLKKRKANNDPAQTSATPVPVENGTPATTSRHDSALDEAVQEQPLNPQKASEKKPRARKTKKADDVSVDSAKVEEAAKGAKPRKRQTTARKSTKTVSKHFSPDNVVDAAAPKTNAPVPVDTPAEPLDLSPAMTRRKSWTPPKDTKSSPNGHDPLEPLDLCRSPEGKASVALGPKPSFTELLNAFGYEGQRAGSEALTARTESGEAFTKRRRLEQAEVSVPESHEVLSEKSNKPEKAPRKKPRTITDLVTAAYRPTATVETSEAQNQPVDPKVSAFFAPRADSTSGAAPPDAQAAEKPKRTGRPRNPTKKAESKAKKPTAKSKKAAKLAAEKLLSPESALIRMNRQDILFGTSSQLAREESPTFVRDLQQALRDSEVLGSQVDSLETLHLKPAVSGSGLSLVGRRTGLWTAASRDHEDGILEQQENSISLGSETNVFLDDDLDFVPENAGKVPSPTQHQAATTYVDASEQATEETQTAVLADCGTYDLPEAPSKPLIGDDDFENFPSAQPVQPSSDFIDIDEFDHDNRLSQQPNRSTLPTSYSTSQPSPNACRTALQSLGTRPNIPLFSQSVSDMSSNQAKATMATKAGSRGRKASTAVEESPTKRPVGRPRKVVPSEESPTKRSAGRPRKAAASEEAAVAHVTLPPKRPVGRPPKATAAKTAKSPPSSPKRKARSPSIATPSATPKKKKKTARRTTEEEYPNIDDIEDSQEEVTPSPPRRKKGVATRPPLTLSLSQEERTTDAAFRGPTVPAPSNTKRKGTERIPGYYLEAVFPKITTAVKACPPSDDPLQPSWHEKMLLYDPIVVEDLAQWLIGQGMQIGVIVPVAEPKTKRRKKDDPLDDETPIEGPPGRNEMQELPAWAVQKWCNANSVCCMFKESQWNGRGRKKKRR
ncbi:Structure-specific endonuclease subunit SLX4 [Diplodia seriata]|uniref:Structure-specific endonuclease subunit SLX4 n=1 Tax=Diplodia seriata TaxID=420778 RepID=A0A1S8BGI0_9PEZI|nr:Structure-specific endonuclease subunit SLX4 [Diplodia seriata]